MAKQDEDEIEDVADEGDGAGADPSDQASQANAEIVAELAKMRETGTEPPIPKPKSKKQKDGDEDVEDEEDGEDAGAKTSEKKKADGGDDPKVATSLAAIATATRRGKAEVDAYKSKATQEIEGERAKLKQERDGFHVEQRAKLRQDPAKYFEDAGFKPEDLADLGRSLFIAAAGDSADPAMKRQAEEWKRMRAQASRAEELQREIDELKTWRSGREDEDKKRAEDAEKQSAKQAAVDYLNDQIKTQTPETAVLFSHWSKKQAAGGAAEFLLDCALAWKQSNPDADEPTTVELFEMAEKRLEKLYDDDFKQYLKLPKKENRSNADEKKTATRTLTNEHAARTSPRTKAKTIEELDDEILDDIRQGKHIQAFQS